METILYLVRVSACTAGFYIVYFLFFRKLTAFPLNRAFLVAGLIASFIIPTVNLSIVPSDNHLDATAILTKFSIQETTSSFSKETPLLEKESFPFLPFIYWGGVVVCCLGLIRSIAQILALKRRSKIVSTTGSVTILKADVEQPFSFFNFIFLPQQEDDEAVIQHETSHVTRFHWVDLAIVQASAIVLWFNPIMILYKRSLKIQHEYEADASVLSRGIQLESYLDCMLQHLQLRTPGELISSFYSQNIKQRIIMMTQNNSGRSYKLLYLLFAPLAFTLLAAFSDAPLNTGVIVHSLTPNNPDDITVIIDPGHGGDDAGSRTAEITEKDIALSIAKSIQSAGEKMGVKIILTRTADNGVSLEDRLSVVTRTKASMFVSIHVNYNEKNAASSGIEIMVSEKNKQFEKSNRIAEKLKSELSLLGGLKVNGIKNANYNVLSQNASPAALVELGYLSNKADYNYITSSKNQQAVAEHVMKAIAASLK